MFSYICVKISIADIKVGQRKRNVKREKKGTESFLEVDQKKYESYEKWKQGK